MGKLKSRIVAATALLIGLAPGYASAAPILGSFSLGGFAGSFVGGTAATATGLDFGTGSGVGNGYGTAGSATVANATGSFASLNGTMATIADIALGATANPFSSSFFVTFGSSNIVVNFANAVITRSSTGTSITVAGPATFTDGTAADTASGMFSLSANSQTGNPTDTNFTFTSNVSATGAVPEPTAWAMMILGVGAVGFALRRGVRASEVRFNAKIKRIASGEVA